MKILNDELHSSTDTKTYASPNNATQAARSYIKDIDSDRDEFMVVIAAVGNRYAPVFLLSEKQTVMASAIARNGFMAVRR